MRTTTKRRRTTQIWLFVLYLISIIGINNRMNHHKNKNVQQPERLYPNCCCYVTMAFIIHEPLSFQQRPPFPTMTRSEKTRKLSQQQHSFLSSFIISTSSTIIRSPTHLRTTTTSRSRSTTPTFVLSATSHTGTTSATTTTNNKNQTKENNTAYIIPTGITLKIAVDLNGGVVELATATAESLLSEQKRFTNSNSLDMVHRLRCTCDVILIGSNTVRVDNPTLTIRRNITCRTRESTKLVQRNHLLREINKGPTNNLQQEQQQQQYQPIRVILDPQLSFFRTIDPSTATSTTAPSTTSRSSNDWRQYKVFTDGLPTMVYYTNLLLPESKQNNNNNNNEMNQQQQQQIIQSIYNELDTWHGLSNTNTTTTVVDEISDILDTSNVRLVYVPPMTDTTTSSMQQQQQQLSSSSSSGVTLSLQNVIQDLYTNYHVQHIMVEGGVVTARAFLQQQLVDRLLLVRATTVQFQQPLFSNITLEYLQQDCHMEYLGTCPSGVDDMIDYYYTKKCRHDDDDDNVTTMTDNNDNKWPTPILSDWP